MNWGKTKTGLKLKDMAFERGSAMEKPISQHLASDKPQPSRAAGLNWNKHFQSYDLEEPKDKA